MFERELPGATGFYAHNLRKLGHTADVVTPNNAPGPTSLGGRNTVCLFWRQHAPVRPRAARCRAAVCCADRSAHPAARGVDPRILAVKCVRSDRTCW